MTSTQQTSPTRSSWQRPDYTSPFDRDAWNARIPTGVRVRGVTFASFARELGPRAKAEFKRRKIRSFKWYPVAELIDYGCALGEMLFPELPIRTQMRNVWRTGFAGFRLESVVGKTLYALSGGTPADLLRRGAQVFEHIHTHARLEIVTDRPNELVIEYRDHWVVPITADAALLEGLFDAMGFTTSMWVKPTDDANGRCLIQWWVKSDNDDECVEF